MTGTAADLLLLDHYEDAWQFTPLLLIAVALPLVGLVWLKGDWRSVVALRVVMILFVASGLLGGFLHFNANKEFQQEMDPGLGGWPLIVKAMRAKAPPALAPAVMVQLGMLGLLCTYRHPALALRTSLPAWPDSTGA